MTPQTRVDSLGRPSALCCPPYLANLVVRSSRRLPPPLVSERVSRRSAPTPRYPNSLHALFFLRSSSSRRFAASRASSSRRFSASFARRS